MIPQAPPMENKSSAPREAAFVAITCQAQPWLDYDQIPEESRQFSVPMGIFLMRWDGTIGLIGGHVDAGESPLQAARRETAEELGARAEWINGADWTPLGSRDLGGLLIHLFSWEVDPSTFKTLLREQSNAAHWMSEGTAFAACLADYGPKPSLGNFLGQRFAPGAKEQLLDLLVFLGANSPSAQTP
jgi:hypothetical protein